MANKLENVIGKLPNDARIIEGTDGKYAVDPMGNVYSIYKGYGRMGYRTEPKILKPQMVGGERNGKFRYSAVYIVHEGKGKLRYVHRLVAAAFIPNPENKESVNHINGMHNDNRVENLEWMTMKEQANYFITRERFKATMSRTVRVRPSCIVYE